MYCENFNVLFIHIPKTGGQSIAAYFLTHSGLDWEKRERFLMRGNPYSCSGPPQTSHFTIDEYLQFSGLPAEKIEAAIKFCVVRNPWARLWSEYNFGWADRCSWEGFFKIFPDHIIDDHISGTDSLRHIKPQNEFINDDVKVLRFERLGPQFSQFCQENRFPITALPHINAGPSVDYRNQYNKSQKDIVAEFYAKDIAMFGYEFDEAEK